MTRKPCVMTPLMEDGRVRVTRLDFAPGAETGWHTHPLDYVITTQTDCEMMIEEDGAETRRVFVPAGTAYGRVKGTHHNVYNGGKSAMSFIEVELK